MRTFSRKTAYKAKQEMILGSVCCNCGKDCGKQIEYHHIVPLELGGKDIISNLAPICFECHSVIHFGCERKKPERTGRKRKEYDAELLNDVYHRYVSRQLSEKNAMKEIGTGRHIKEMPQFKEWAEKNGVDPDGKYGCPGRWYK